MRYLALLFLLLLSVPATARPTGWQLVWSDEFNGASIDTTKWNVRDAAGNTNNELEYYAPDEVSVSSGFLTLRSQRRTLNGRQYTSGLVETRSKFAQTYGRVEVRAKLPRGQGIWPAHWMLPQSGIWPPEIDIMELLGHDPNTVYMTNHWGVWPTNQHRTGLFTGPDFTADFHEFAVEWTPTRIEWYVDNVLRFASNSGVPTSLPFYIILNTAVGGDWPGNPDASTVFPQYHVIDYVRVYTKAQPDPPLRVFTDFTPQAAATDGPISPGEYTAQLSGINAGWGDRIGAASRLLLDSDRSGFLTIGIDSLTPWPSPTSDGVVIYVDSKPNGLTSTITINDRSDLGRALTSGNARVGTASSNLYFADGFAADDAIFIQDTFAGIFRLSHNSLQFIAGASLDAETDVFGGQAFHYARNPDDPTQRELRLRLADLEITASHELKLVATQLSGDTAQRSNEFVGVAPGNPWDATPSTLNDIQLKPRDFVLFRAQPRCLADWNESGLVDSQDLFDFVIDFFALNADTDNSGSTSSQDFFNFLTAFFTGC